MTQPGISKDLNSEMTHSDTAQNEFVIEVDGVSYAYLGRIPALNNVTVRVRAGERLVVLGANGSGKSTLIRIMAGLIRPDQGKLRAFGREIPGQLHGKRGADLSPDGDQELRRRIGVLFQDSDAQLFCPTVWDEVAFGPLQMAMPEQEIRKRVEEMLGFMRIDHLADRAPFQLSVGEKKKVAIAATLVVNPDVLLLDEPTAGLDPRTCRILLETINTLHKNGKTVVVATHDLHVVAEIADRVMVLSEEKTVVAEDSATGILSNTTLLEEYNLLHVHMHLHKSAWHIHPHAHNKPKAGSGPDSGEPPETIPVK